MRMKRFFAAAAMAPLCFAALGAHAQTTISTATTTAVKTSTTGDLTINPGASITVTDGAAVTLDTPANVINNGTIDIKDAPSPATGILVTAPSGSVVSSGIVNVTDTETLKDADGDGDLDGVFVTSTVPKFGVRVTNPFTGNINQSGGQILIRGNNSAAIAIESGMTGNLTVRGQAVLVGANSYGLRINGPFIGDIDLGGSISAQGQNSEGVSIQGPVTGRLILQGAVIGTGYRYGTRALNFDLSKLDADDLQLGGPAVRVTSSVTGGILVNAATLNSDDLDPDNNTSTPDITDPHPDEDGDGIADASETDATITAYGSAPALLIAGPGSITLGNVGTGLSAYGLAIKGSVIGNGLFDGFDATAVQLGGGGGTVNTSGGVRISGLVFGSAALANARGIVFGAGSSAPTLLVDGQLQAATTSTAAVSPSATALQIDAGGNLATLTNNGIMVAGIQGVSGTATVIQDNSGTLGQITNTGTIRAGLAQLNADDVIVGHSVAMNLAANTTGVSITQTHNVAETVTPSITGDIVLGSGDDSLTVLEGAVSGDIAFGGGANSLTINGTKTTTDATTNVATTVVNGSVTGKISTTGTLALSVQSGSLINTSTAAVNLTTLNVGSAGTLAFTLNPSGVGGTGTQYLVAGPASFASGSKIDLVFGSKLATTQTFNLVQAGSLVNNAGLLGATPFIYSTALNTSANALSVTVARRTTDQLGLFSGRAAAYDPVFAAFDADAGVSQALLSKTDEASFASFYNQLLPDYSGGVFHSLATASRAVMRAQGDEPAGMQTNQRRSWLQEVGFTTKNEGSGQDIHYDSAGFGLAGGIEDPLRGGAVRGLSIAFVSSDVDDQGRRGFSKLTASALIGSLYWRRQYSDHLLVNASLNGGYAWFDSDRHVIDEDSSGARILQRQAGGKWNGALGAARLAASYDMSLGRIYIRPDASLDYVYLYEDGYQEHGGGVSVDLAVNHRTSYEASAEAGVTVGATFGRAMRWTPELRVAYRTILSEGLSETSARFLAGGNPFLMRALGVDQNRLVVRAAVRGGSRYANVALEATGDLGDVYTAYEGRLVVRFIF
jgi:hypothetical protein